MKKEKSTPVKSYLNANFVFDSGEKKSKLTSMDKKYVKKHKHAILHEDESCLDDEYYYGRYDIQENFLEAEEEFND
ncbi:MAG: hypothetical protein H0X62_00900 [Bacteroidetes bacterium]|nr:hypothetical protein [Bacteroidota bacterium]